MDISRIKLTDIQPSQFYISENKLRAITEWFDPNDLSNFVPVPIKPLNGRIIFTDGHTRAWAAYCAGLEYIPLAWDEDDMDWEEYQICVDACIERGIHSIADMADRLLPGDKYEEKWLGWCRSMQNDLAKRREDTPTAL